MRGCWQHGRHGLGVTEAQRCPCLSFAGTCYSPLPWSSRAYTFLPNMLWAGLLAPANRRALPHCRHLPFPLQVQPVPDQQRTKGTLKWRLCVEVFKALLFPFLHARSRGMCPSYSFLLGRLSSPFSLRPLFHFTYVHFFVCFNYQFPLSFPSLYRQPF